MDDSQGLRDVLSGRKRLSVELLSLLATHCGVDAGYITTGIRKGEEHKTAAAQVLRVRVLASLLGDELHKAKTSLEYEVFTTVLDGLWLRYGQSAEMDLEAARKEVRALLGRSE
ncbi:hypothetical protein GHU20_13480 [Pseudomonas aeruginosa]|nr:hypothetical protein [Pseudomonas aeruginosa]